MSKARRSAAGGRRPGASRRRSAARLAAVQALYEMDMVGAPADAVLAEFMAKRWRFSAGEDRSEAMAEPDNAWLTDLVHGVSSRAAELDGTIAPTLSSGMTLNRLETLLRVVLRAGTYELKTKLEVPAAVVINEYVEVANAFFEGKEAALVNGVLDRLARELRAGEL
ncbi:MAG: transcription antitermination factor NusB [Rhodospirillales bacterium]|nr:transcription antitermination factor NusB [Rhodospirillales bacterium]